MNDDDALYERALRLLARRAHSRAELVRKLSRKIRRGEFAPESLAEVLRRLERCGYLDDAAFARGRALFQRTEKNWGRRRIAHDLRRRGIDARITRRILEEVEREKPERKAVEDAAERWMGRFGPPADAAGVNRLFEHCLRLGHDPDAVRRQLSGWWERLSAPPPE